MKYVLVYFSNINLILCIYIFSDNLYYYFFFHAKIRHYRKKILKKKKLKTQKKIEQKIFIFFLYLIHILHST